MRALIAALILTLVVAVTASVFAIWPVITDAPWEDELMLPTPVAVRQPTKCETLTQQLADAQTELAARSILARMRQGNC